jgi:hypothetical protein
LVFCSKSTYELLVFGFLIAVLRDREAAAEWSVEDNGARRTKGRSGSGGLSVRMCLRTQATFLCTCGVPLNFAGYFGKKPGKPLVPLAACHTLGC